MKHLLLICLAFLFTGCIFKNQPVNNLSWKIAAVLPAMPGQTTALGLAGPITGISNEVLIVAGGANFPDSMPWMGGKKRYYDDACVFIKGIGDSLGFFRSVSMPFTLAYAATCSTSHGIFVGGGENESGIRNEVRMIQWGASQENIIVSNLPPLPRAVTNASAVCINDIVYLAGGESGDSVSNDFLCLDLNDTGKGWVRLEPLQRKVSHSVMAVAQDVIYMVGGRKRNTGGISDLYITVSAYDLKTKHWSAKSPLPFALSAGTGAAIHNRYLFLFGGDTGETFHRAEDLIARISSETDTKRKSVLNDEKARLQSAHPGFSRQILIYDTQTDKWKHFDSMPFPSPATTTAVVWGDEVLIPSGEIRAGVRTPQILSAKFK